MPLDANLPPEDVSDPSFWNALYRTRDTGWDKGQVAPPIARMLEETALREARELLVLGAGRGHDAIHAARLGYQVTAVDFAEDAVQAIQAAAQGERLPLQALKQDLFLLPRSHPGSFDAALEHTCFCAIDPARKGEYAGTMQALLRPGGLYFGLFYGHARPGGPPYTTNEAEVRELFGPLFHFDRLQVAPDSFTKRAGHELEFVFRRR